MFFLDLLVNTEGIVQMLTEWDFAGPELENYDA